MGLRRPTLGNSGHAHLWGAETVWPQRRCRCTTPPVLQLQLSGCGLSVQGPDSCIGWRRGRPTDIYALGACLFTFVYGRIPFSAPTVYQLFQVVQTEPLKFPEEPAVSDDLKDLLYQMLIKVVFFCLLRTCSAADK